MMLLLAACAPRYPGPAAPAERCRVLELGCGLGSNLVPMAALLPRSTFVGVDLSAEQIRRGREDVAALGLANVDLQALDLRDIGPECGDGEQAGDGHVDVSLRLEDAAGRYDVLSFLPHRCVVRMHLPPES